MDIKPVRKNSVQVPGRKEVYRVPGKTQIAQQKSVQSENLSKQPELIKTLSLKRSVLRQPKLMLGLSVSLVIVMAFLLVCWFYLSLAPVSGDGIQVRIVIKPGDTASAVASTLYDHKLIRSKSAFKIYTHITKTRTKLQAGGYVLSPNQDVQSIVDHITNGRTDEMNVTIPPGVDLNELKSVLIRLGYSGGEVDRAYSASYDHPLLATRPSGASLEGYIYPETYRVGADQPLEKLFNRSFDEMYNLMKDKKYLDELSKRSMTIHQAVTLASIIQKEVSNPKDQKQVAQVFIKRLSTGMALGSDVTFMYAAKQLGVQPSVDLDSPYNTRKYTGLPPGPISNMNPSAIEAVAFPAAGDYLFFVAGDDGTTYFALDEDQHNANIKAHCTILCR